MLRRIVRILRRRWLISLLIAVLLSALVWWGGPLIGIAGRVPLATELVRFAVILTLFVGWGFDNLRTQRRERRAGEQLTQAMSESGGPAVAAGTQDELPDAEQAILARKLREAFKTLERARLDRGRRLYQLPWYIVIGAPGSGKTTALKNSGLRFPLESQLGDNPVQGSGGTRYCDWWFTDQAVLLDTAGRYTSQDSASAAAGQAWRGFLGELKRSRPKRPLNGILVAVSIEELCHRTPTQQALQAVAIKRRIQELNAHLDMELPVYLLVTKCDLVAGFDAFFADLDQEARKQPWGVAFPMAAAADTGVHLERFPGLYRDLLIRLRDCVLHRLDGEIELKRRELAFAFPSQMLALESTLLAFLREIFIPNQFEQPALLRGVYFVSGTQAERNGHWLATVLPTELLSAPPGRASSAASSAFFLEHLFSKIIFGEAHLASVDRRAERRYRLSYAALLAAICLLFSTAGSALYLSQRENHRYLDRVVDDMVSYRETTGGGLVTGERDWAKLAAGLDQLHGLQRNDADSSAAHTLRQLGLSQRDKVGRQAGRVYQATLERLFMPRIADELAGQVREAASDDHLYEGLRFYLMLYHPERLDRKALADWMGRLWLRHYPGEEHAPLRASLGSHLDGALAAETVPPPLNRELVSNARKTLAVVPAERRIYRQIKTDYLQRMPGEFSVESVLGRRAATLFHRPSGKPLTQGVPLFFTYQAFHTHFKLERRQFTSRLADEAWIYGSDEFSLSGEQIEAISEKVTALYLEEYVLAWRALLDDLAVIGFAEAESGRDVVQTLLGPDTLLIRLLLAVREHTALSELPSASDTVLKVAEIATQNVMSDQRRRFDSVLPDDVAAEVALPGSEVSTAFELFNEYAAAAERSSLQRLQQALMELNRHLDALASSEDPDRGAFDMSRDSRHGDTALQKLRSALAVAPPVVRRWFGPVFDSTRQLTQRGAAAHANEVWRNDVLPFYEKAIKGRYPVDPEAEREIRIDDFTHFFGPGGLLDSYAQRYVLPFVDTTSTSWRWRQPVGMSASALQLFQRIRHIRQAWFTGDRAQVAFSLRPYTLDTAVTHALLDFAGQQVRYSHGPVRASRLQWRAGGTGTSRLVFSLASQSTPVSVGTEGEWSWFRLLDRHAKQELRPDGSVLLTVSVEGLVVQYELEPLRAVNPFTDTALRHFELPSRL